MTRTKSLRTALSLIIVVSGLVLLAPSPAQAASTTITLTGPVTPAITYEAIIFEGQVTQPGATSRVVLQKQVGDVWKDLNGLAPSSDGSFEIPFQTTERGTYHLRVRSQHGNVVSNVIELTVAPHPTQVFASVQTGGRDVFVGQKLWVTGHVVEPGATPRVVVQRKVNGKWSDRASGAVAPDGQFAIAITPTQAGFYDLRVRTNGGSKWSLYPMTFVALPKPVPVPASS